jgi:hypothetical protein
LGDIIGMHMVHRLKPEVRQNQIITTSDQREDFRVCIADRVDRDPALSA